MARQWFYRHGEREYGPVSSALLKELADSGRLLPADIVWPEDSTERVPASRIKGLFASERKQETSIGSRPQPAKQEWVAANAHPHSSDAQGKERLHDTVGMSEKSPKAAVVKPRTQRRLLLWLGGGGFLVVLIAAALFAGWHLGHRGQAQQTGQSAPANPAKTEWTIVTEALKECKTGEELFQDADDPSATSRVRKSREAQEHLDRAKSMVASLPKELQHLIELRVEVIVKLHASRVATAEAMLLEGPERRGKLIDAQLHASDSKIANDFFWKHYLELKVKYE